MFKHRAKYFGLDKAAGDSLDISRKARMLEIFNGMSIEQVVLCLKYLIETSRDDWDLDQSKFMDVLQEFSTHDSNNIRFTENRPTPGV